MNPQRRLLRNRIKTFFCYKVVFVFILFVSNNILISISLAAVSRDWEQKVAQIRWVAYSPPTSDPIQGTEATPEAIQKDLQVLLEAGFTGLVTYSLVSGF